MLGLLRLKPTATDDSYSPPQHMSVSPSPTADVVSRSLAAAWDEETPEDGVSAGCPPIHWRISFSVCCTSSIFRVDFSFCFLALANSCLSSPFSFSMFSILAVRPGWRLPTSGRRYGAPVQSLPLFPRLCRAR
ncbi:hypothetical protein MRX96_006154 [Rhipicephalus microplus]